MVDSSSETDVNPLFARAAAELESGEMLHAEDFNLGSVMNAIVMGDPRLDAGKLQKPCPPGINYAVGGSPLLAGSCIKRQVKSKILCSSALSKLFDAGARKRPVPQSEFQTGLSAVQVLAVMDKLLVAEATWQHGATVAQTVYTCQYLLHQHT